MRKSFLSILSKRRIFFQSVVLFLTFHSARSLFLPFSLYMIFYLPLSLAYDFFTFLPPSLSSPFLSLSSHFFYFPSLFSLFFYTAPSHTFRPLSTRLLSPAHFLPPRIFFLQHVTLYALSLFFHRFIRPHSQLSTLPFVIFYIFSTVSIRSMSFNFSTLKLWLPKCFKGHPKHDIARSVSEHKIHLPSLFSIGVFGMVDSKSSQYFIYEVLHVYKLQELCFK